MSSVTSELAVAEIRTLDDDRVLDDLTLFHRNLARMCRAGVPLPRALRSLQGELSGRRMRQSIADMATAVEAGETFQSVYAGYKNDFPELYHALVATGIQTGDLAGVLEEIASHAELRARIVSRLRGALSYPVMIAILVLVIGSLVTFFAQPFTAIVSPGAIGVQNIGPESRVWILMTLAMGALLLLVMGTGVFVWLRNPVDASTGPFGAGFRVPFIGRLRSYATKAWFASTLAMLLRRRIPLEQALSYACLAQNNRRVREQIQKMAAAASAGEALHESIRHGELISPGLLWFVETSTSPADAAAALDDIARVYRQRLDRSLDRLCQFALPAFEVCIGVVVLLFALSFVFPALDNIGSILGWFKL